jgi:hypothetical protein
VEPIGQLEEMVDEFAADRGLELGAGVRRDVPPERAQPQFERHQRQHPDRQHVQRLQRAVIDDLVVDGHHEQRRCQRQQVDHYGREADLPQNGPHATHRSRAPEATPRRAGPEKDQPVAEARGDRRFAWHGRAVHRLDQYLLVVGPRPHQPRLAGLATQDQERRCGRQ